MIESMCTLLYVIWKEINLSGSGKVIGESKFDVEDLDISVSGSGKLDMDVHAENIESGISGSGNITLGGSFRKSPGVYQWIWKNVC